MFPETKQPGDLQQRLAGMSSGQIEALLRAPAGAAGQRDPRLCDAAWLELQTQRRPRDAGWAGACLAVAEQNYALRRYARAEKAAAQAAKTYRTLKDDLAGAICDLLLASTLSNAGQFSKALGVAEKAKETLSSHGRGADAAICDYVRGKALRGLGLDVNAVEAYADARKALSTCGESADAARCDLERGNALQTLERYQESIDAYENAKTVFLALGMPAEAATCDAGRGVALQGLGRYQEAIDSYDQANQAFLRLDMPADAAACDCSRGVALQSLERYREAIGAYERARPVLLRHGRPADAAACDAGRGAALDSLGEYTKAIPAFLAAKSGYRSCHQYVAAARCDLERGNALQAVEHYEEAVAAYKQAKVAYLERGQIIDAARCDANRGVALSRVGQYQKAITSFTEACPVLTEFEQFRALAWAQCGLAACQLALGDQPRALESYLAACGSLEMAVGAASGETKEYSDFREQFPEPFLPALRLYLARLAGTQDADPTTRPKEAYEEAFILSERYRNDAFREDLVRSVRRHHVDLGTRHPELVSQWHDTKQKQALLAGRIRAAGKLGATELRHVVAEDARTRERLQLDLSSVEEALLVADPETAGILSGQLPPLSEALGCLAQGEGLISYLESNEDLVCFFADGRGLIHTEVLRGAARIAREALASFKTDVAEFLAGRDEGAKTSEIDELASLGALLLTPAKQLGWFEAGVSAKSRLRIVPPPSLWSLPFAALGLPGGSVREPLVSRTEVVIAPQVVTAFYQRRKKPQGSGVAAIGEPGGLAMRRLRSTLEQVWPGQDINWYPEGESVNAGRIAQKITGCRYLHLSGQGRAASDGWRESGAAIGGNSGSPPGNRLLSDLYGVVDPRELAVIDIPSDIMGRSMGSDHLVGLSRALLHSARQLVLTLWEDPNQDEDSLMYRFYAGVREGWEPITALAEAQRHCLVSEEPSVSHPFYWSRLVAAG